MATVQKANMIGASTSCEIKSFKFFEDYTENQATNDKFLSYLRLIEFKGDLNTLAPYLNPVVANAKSCEPLHRKFRCPPISLENEKIALMKMKLIAEKCLSKYPNSYEEDMKILAEKKDITFNQRNCMIFRSGEKKVQILIPLHRF